MLNPTSARAEFRTNRICELAADGPRADIVTRETIRDIFEIDAVVHQADDGVPYVLPQSMRAAASPPGL